MGDLLSRVICPGALLFLSWVGMVECCDLSFVSHPGRPLWLRPAGLQTRIRWNVVVPTMLPHSRGRWGPGRAGPILLAASRSHSPERCTAHPEPAPGPLFRGLVVRLQTLVASCLLLLRCLRRAPLRMSTLRRRTVARRPVPRRSRRSATAPPATCGQRPRP
jgi:hypothetical protein